MAKDEGGEARTKEEEVAMLNYNSLLFYVLNA